MPQQVSEEESLNQSGSAKLRESRSTRFFSEQLKRINVVSTVAVVLIAVVLVVFSVVFAIKISSDIDGYVEDEARSVMGNFTEHISEDVSTNLNSWYGQLDMACGIVSNMQYDAGAADNSQFDEGLQSLADYVKFEKFGLVLNEKNADGSSGVLYVSEGETYSAPITLDAVSGGSTYIGEIEIDGEKRIILAVPYDESASDVLMGVAGILSPDDFSAFLETAVFSEQSYLVIVEADGDVVAFGDVGDKNYTDNFITDLNTMGIDYETLNKIKNDLSGGASSIVKYSYLGEEYFMYYSAISESLTADLPLPVAGWRVVMIVEADAISSGMVGAFNVVKGMLIGVTSVLAVVVLMLVITYSRSYINNLLLKYTDSVTGGINQHRFAVDGARLIGEGTRDYALVSLNVRHFKLINDEYGRAKGDELLAEVFNAIEGRLAEGELAARGYADRYLLLLTDDGAFGQKLEELYDYLSDYDYMGGGLKLKFIMGVYRFAEGDKHNLAEAVDRARLARVNGTQTAGGRAITYFTEDMLDVEKQESEMEKRAEAALKNGDFVVYYQLKRNIQNDSWCGAEALVRWKDPERGMIPPGKFIPLFERNGMVVELDKYVFEHVCADIRRSLDDGKPVVPVSVNLSREHFMHENFFDEYEDILARYAVPHKYIEFEITESLVMEREDELKRLIDRIHEIGCRCSIDDFGSGYSSLNMLHDYKFDVIKLDGKFFMSESGFGADSKKIVSALIRLFHDLDKEVVAEGVENKETVDILKNDGCDTVQGYYFARPVPYDEFEARLCE